MILSCEEIYIFQCRNKFETGAKNVLIIVMGSASNPVNIYLFKVNNRNTRKRPEICSKLITKTPFCVDFIVDVEQINVSWEMCSSVGKFVLSNARASPSAFTPAKEIILRISFFLCFP